MAVTQFGQTLVVSGLGTIAFVSPYAGPVQFNGQITLPTLTNGGGASSLVVTANLNGGGAFYTGAAGASGFQFVQACAVGDTVNVILTSAAAPDNALNAIKTTLAISSGVGV